jgi:hypothetical protein
MDKYPSFNVLMGKYLKFKFRGIHIWLEVYIYFFNGSPIIWVIYPISIIEGLK